MLLIYSWQKSQLINNRAVSEFSLIWCLKITKIANEWTEKNRLLLYGEKYNRMSKWQVRESKFHLDKIGGKILKVNCQPPTEMWAVA